MRVAFLLLERSVLWVRIDVALSVLASPVPEFFLCHVAPDIGSGHDPHDLLVVVQDAQSWLVFPFRQEIFEFLVLRYISLCLRVVYCHSGVLGADLPQGLGARWQEAPVKLLLLIPVLFVKPDNLRVLELVSVHHLIVFALNRLLCVGR